MSKKRNSSAEGHNIRIPGTILDQIKSERSYDEDERFSQNSARGKRKSGNLSRKDRRQQERQLKKAKRGHTSIKPNRKIKDTNENERRIKLEEDSLADLHKLKRKRKSLDGGFRIVKEDKIEDQLSDELDDDLDIDDEADKTFGNDEEGGSDWDNDFGDSDIDSYSEEQDYENPLEKLRKIKEEKIKKAKSLPEKSMELKYDQKGEAKRNKTLKSTGKTSSTNIFEQDDREIEYYAKKLGLKGGKNARLQKTGENDTIGGLLDGLDLDYGSGEEYDDMPSDKLEDNNNDFHDFDSEVDDYDNDHHDDIEEESSIPRNENPFGPPVEDEQESEENVKDQRKLKKYVPPAMRRILESKDNESEEDVGLKKQVKSSFNKLTEANVGSIVSELNNLFNLHSRKKVSETIMDIIFGNIAQESGILDTFVFIHGLVVVCLHTLTGGELGAYFVQILVEKIYEFRKAPDSSKEVSNLISLLSAIYALQLVSSRLIFDIVKDMLNEFTEENAELLLRLIKNSGNQMRSDDPSALKEIIFTVGEISKKKSDISPRMQYLIETIASLKSKKLKVSEVTRSLVVRLKKILVSLTGSKSGNPIQVTLDDIQNVEKRGKWWLVGAAWKGQDEKPKESATRSFSTVETIGFSEPNWMELARNQRMNTDIRRAIFIAIMSASDYIDSMTRLEKLRLKKSQIREIPIVVIHCTRLEPAWNPYYGVLASKLCSMHAYRKAFQFFFWDWIKLLEGSDEDSEFGSLAAEDEDEETQLRKLLNTGRLFGFMLAEGALGLPFLRTVNFLSSSDDANLFLESLFVTFFDKLAKKSKHRSDAAHKSKGKLYDEKLIIEKLLPCRDDISLLRGIQYFLKKKVKNSSIVQSDSQAKRRDWGIQSMSDIIEEFLSTSEQAY